MIASENGREVIRVQLTDFEGRPCLAETGI
jgi:hypothetical protein